MTDRSEPVNFVDESNRPAVVAIVPSRACRPQRTFRDRPSPMAAFAADAAAFAADAAAFAADAAAFVADRSRKQAGGQ